MKKLITIAALLLAASLIQGRAADATATWDKDCAKCHGKDGKGETKMGKRLGVKDYTDPKVQASFTDEQAMKSIKDGVKAEGKEKMKGFGDQLSDDQIKALVAHIRSFKKSS